MNDKISTLQIDFNSHISIKSDAEALISLLYKSDLLYLLCNRYCISSCSTKYNILITANGSALSQNKMFRELNPHKQNRIESILKRVKQLKLK